MTPNEFRDLRAQLGWSQAETARELGVSVAAIKSYERGRRSVPEPTARLLLLLAKR